MDESTAGPPEPAGPEPHRLDPAADPDAGGSPQASHSWANEPPAWWADHDLPGSSDPLQDHSPLSHQVEMGLAPPVGTDDERRRPVWPILAAAVLASLLTVGGLALLGVFDEADPVIEATPPEIVEIREIITDGGEGTTFSAVGRKVIPSIVSIEVGSSSGQDFRQFGVGSGVVLTSDGLIVTNHHVIEDANAVQVVLQDGTFYEAEIVGSDASTDLAVLRIGARDLLPIDIGNSEDIAIGDLAVAVGNPLGLRGGASLTTGVVSARDREVRATGAPPLYGMLQTDAPITQGSSGGALVDEGGRLVGITTAIGVSTAGAEGIGFAIPVELMGRITDEIIAEGAVRHAFLGVELETHFDSRPDGANVPAGALVPRLANPAESAAAAAGVVAGDVIIGFEGRQITNPEELISAIRRLRVGDEVDVDVQRGDDELSFRIVLGERPFDQ